MKQYKKIDLFWCGDYLCSTNQSKTCKEARQKYLEKCSDVSLLERRIKKMPQYLKASFSK